MKGVPNNPCFYKGVHTAHKWQATGGRYEYWCCGIEELLPR